MNYIQRRRARLLIKRAQPFADEPLTAVANFTWVGSGMGSRTGGREDLAGGLPMWTLIGAGATRLFVVETDKVDPDRGERLVGSWPLNQSQIDEETLDRVVGPVQLGVYRAVRFALPGRDPAVLQPFGREVEDLLEAHRAAQPNTRSSDGLTQVALMTTSRESADDDAFFVLTYGDGRTTSVPVGEAHDLLGELQDLPGFDNEEFIRAIAVTDEGVSVLWRA
ncbi:hypothetical protein CIW49_11565 [Mycolicibacterium sp. P1-18]|uniref:hypothetical protein n=1 Tax=Mycolicibacterium sp. P1-18 TaxID=2024615 RepID=UPI0011F27D4F|nr:hypothetical protein [Mycolicibacterium sp. P1-18]KAA0098565.1 hypothetical protein CIW49_11565 [Mycolicibacterium sp. P1-18]